MWPALISIGLGLLNFGANAKGADAKKTGMLLQANEYDLQADEILKTHKMNVGMAGKKLVRNVAAVRKKGAYDVAKSIAAGERRGGKIRARIGSSGAAMGEFTPASVQIQQAAESHLDTLMVKSNIVGNIEVMKQDYLDWKTVSDYNANLSSKQMRRRATLTRKSAQSGYEADMLGALTGGLSTGLNTYGAIG